jgi:hypothetical protein
VTQLGPVAIWNVLLDQAREDDAFEAIVSATDALSDEQVEAELHLAGVPLAELHAAALASLGESAPALPDQPVQAVAQVVRLPSIEKPKRRRPAVFWLAAAATTATAFGGVLYATLHSPSQPAPEPAPVPSPSSPAPVVSAPPDLVAARDLRARARDALAMGYATQCLDLLDQAKSIDPAGDAAPDIVALRRKASVPEKTRPLKPSLK